VVQHQRNASTLQRIQNDYVPLALGIFQLQAHQSVFIGELELSRDPDGTYSDWLQSARWMHISVVRGAIERLDSAIRFEPPPVELDALKEIRARLREAERHFTDSRTVYSAADLVGKSIPKAVLSAKRQALLEREKEAQLAIRAASRTLREQIHLTTSKAELQERRARLLVGVLSVISLMMGLVIIWWSGRLLKPLPRLLDRVVRVTAGELSVEPLVPRSNDEFGQLTREFEVMVAALSAREAKLQEAYEAQALLHRMQEQILAGLRAAVVVIDGQERIRTANRAAERLLGLVQDDVGKTIEDVGLTERLRDLVPEVRRSHARARRAVLRGVVLAPEDRRVDLLVTPFGDDGRSLLLVVEDVTEELRTKDRLIHTERLAAIGRMAAHVTHEVRNPLSSIGLNVELLADEVRDDPEARSLLSEVQNEIDRLTAITEQYLRLARVPAPRLEPEDMALWTRSVCEFLRREIEAAGVVFDVSIGTQLPLVAIDENQMRQALVNLLRNAREAVPGGGCVGLSVAGDHGGVFISVRDDGDGIPPEEREHIFDLLYTTKERGTGLGLPLTQQVVAAHGGSIICESQPGEGTTFRIWLPSHAEEERRPIS
ncbi:MAG: ATP-binding protein, partial [Myxococcota bacterium]